MRLWASAAVNAAIGVSALAAVGTQVRRSSFLRVMRYFTALSNVFCALACLVLAACRAAGVQSQGALLLKYVGTVSVTVTLLTVFFFLIPQFGVKSMLGGADLWLHLLCPVAALISYFAWDRPAAPPACALLGALPVLLYGLLYLWRTIYDRSERRWEDFYGFNRGGRWKLSFAAMIAGTLLVCAALWAL